MVMGHALAQWSKWYDIDFHTRESQQAVMPWPLGGTACSALLTNLHRSSMPQHPSKHLSHRLPHPQSQGTQAQASMMQVIWDAGWSSVDDDESVSFHDEDDDDFAIDIHDS